MFLALPPSHHPLALPALSYSLSSQTSESWPKPRTFDLHFGPLKNALIPPWPYKPLAPILLAPQQYLILPASPWPLIFWFHLGLPHLHPFCAAPPLSSDPADLPWSSDLPVPPWVSNPAAPNPWLCCGPLLLGLCHCSQSLQLCCGLLHWFCHGFL